MLITCISSNYVENLKIYKKTTKLNIFSRVLSDALVVNLFIFKGFSSHNETLQFFIVLVVAQAPRQDSETD